MNVLQATGFGVKRGRQPVVSELALALEPARITALLGPNGSGKTSTMLGLLDLLPHSGTVEIFDAVRRSAADRASIGFVPQEGGIPSGATAREWITLQAQFRGAAPTAVDALIAALGIPTQRRLARRLSGGERRRVALAAALVGNPRLLVLDEPTAGMDPEIRAVAIRLIRQAADNGAAVLLSTHQLDEILECADIVAVMQRGSIVRSGPLTELLGASPRSWSPSDQANTLRQLFGENP